MTAKRRGHLLFMSSLLGKAAMSGTSVYSATKYGLRGFASSLRHDLRDTGVGVSVVFPGVVREAGMFADAKVDVPPGDGHQLTRRGGGCRRQRDREEPW